MRTPRLHLPTVVGRLRYRPWPAAPRRHRRRPDRRPDGCGVTGHRAVGRPGHGRRRTGRRAARHRPGHPARVVRRPGGQEARPRHRHAGPPGRRLRAQRHAARARRGAAAGGHHRHHHSPAPPRRRPRPLPPARLRRHRGRRAGRVVHPRAVRRRPPASGARRPSVQVAVSEAAARALDLQVGDRIPARDEHGRSVVVAISGTFVPDDAGDEAWQVAPQLLEPTTSTSADEPRTAAAALVSDESLADLRFALPGDALRRRVVFAPEPAAVTWRRSAALERTVAALQSGAGVGSRRDVVGQPARHRPARRACPGRRRTRSGAGAARGSARLRAARPRAGRAAVGAHDAPGR